MNNNEDKKEKFIDDNHTIYNMDLDGMPKRRASSKGNELGLTRKERRALIRAAFLHFLPIFIGIIICFALAMVLIHFWLK
jgi:hypothetical protein